MSMTRRNTGSAESTSTGQPLPGPAVTSGRSRSSSSSDAPGIGTGPPLGGSRAPQRGVAIRMAVASAGGAMTTSAGVYRRGVLIRGRDGQHRADASPRPPPGPTLTRAKTARRGGLRPLRKSRSSRLTFTPKMHGLITA
jgi:hypothetical protein